MPTAHARPAPQAVVDTIAASATPSAEATCASTLGATFGSRLKAFAIKAFDVTLVFAEWTVMLAIDVAMDSLGQRYRSGKPASRSSL